MKRHWLVFLLPTALAVGVACASSPPVVVREPLVIETEPAATQDAAPVLLAAPSMIQCGEARCRVGVEKCCDSSEKRCTSDKPSFVNQNFESSVCWPPNPQDSNGGAVLFCDDSADCPGAARCCMTDDGMPGWYRAVCVAGFGACSFGELCSTDHGCPAPYVCSGGRCVLPNADLGVHCGNKRCGGDTPLCCERATPTCVANDKECAGSGPPTKYRCKSPADCGSLQVCYDFNGRSDCFGSYPNGGLALLCERDADCHWKLTGTIDPDKDLKMRCVPHNTRAWLKVCRAD